MNDKKHIDRLFQEKLKDFEATPSNTVWENISAEIQADKKERKIIPMWMKLSGIAAALLLLFTIGNAVFNTDENTDKDTIVDTNNNPNTDANEIQNDSKKDIIKLNNNNLESEKFASEAVETNSQETEALPEALEQNKLTNKKKDATTNAVVSNNTNNSVNKTSVEQANKTPINQFEDATTDRIKNAVAKNDKINNNTLDKTLDAVANNSPEKTNATINKEAVNTALVNTTSEQTVAKSSNEDNSTNLTENTKEEGEVVKEEEKESLTEAIAENKLQDDEKDEKKKKKKIEDRWKVAPSIAPVYFNTLGSGSSIHEQFNQNSKTGNVNMSYGIRGSYALNKKLSVRAGVNKMSLGYSTNDVFVLNNVSATPTDDTFLLRNVALKDDVQATSFVSADQFNFAQIPAALTDQLIGTIDQKLGFIEVPLEVEYMLSDKKLGLRVIGGFSALFLNENEVYSTLDGQTTLIGSATNINKTSFSANLGVGLDLKLSEKFKLNLEPTFKYQLNTFNNTSGDFKPYFIGIYSGFSFKF